MVLVLPDVLPLKRFLGCVFGLIDFLRLKIWIEKQIYICTLDTVPVHLKTGLPFSKCYWFAYRTTANIQISWYCWAWLSLDKPFLRQVVSKSLREWNMAMKIMIMHKNLNSIRFWYTTTCTSQQFSFTWCSKCCFHLRLASNNRRIQLQRILNDISLGIAAFLALPWEMIIYQWCTESEMKTTVWRVMNQSCIYI